jgi:hypothetical protein
MTPTDETRFHALKFALQTPGVVSPSTVLELANDYHRFLTGAPDEATEIEAKAEEDRAYYAGFVETAMGQSIDLDAMVTESLEAVVAEVEAEEAEAPYEVDYAEEVATEPEPDAWVLNEPEPTFEYIAAAVEEMASPPPPAEEDPSDEPELTTEQVERIEDAVRVAPKEPEPEVKPARAAWVDYVS